ncbi:MAG: prepilin peptidase [Rhodobacteraceae bacterium]|nr:prepilin peptidase [Paracoccaceae bacterium]
MLHLTAPHAYLALLIGALPICAWIFFSDLKRMKIPNRANGALILVFLVVGFLTFPFDAFAWRWMNLVVVLAIGFMLNAAGVMGAGDAKFAAAAAPFFRPADCNWVLLMLAAFLLGALAAHRILRAIPAVIAATPDWASWKRSENRWWRERLPAGIALTGTLVAYLIIMAFELQEPLLATLNRI